MINRIVPDDTLFSVALALALAMAETLAGWNREYLAQTKRTFHRWRMSKRWRTSW